MDHPDISEIIRRSKLNDSQSFRQLVEMYQSFVFRVSFRLLCNEDEALDAVQETFLRVWKHLDSFRMDMRFTTWLYRIATNICYDRIKSLKRHNGHSSLTIGDLAVACPESDNPETMVINKDLARIIAGLTNDLSPKQQLVFTLSDLEGLEVQEIAIITGLSPGKIKSNLYCARQNIRTKLEKLN